MSSMKNTEVLARLEQLLDLRAAAPVRLRGEPVDARLPQPVGLVADEDVDQAGLGGGEPVEVAELGRGPAADDLAEVLGEGLRARDVLGDVPLAAEVTEEVHGQDGLPRPRPPEDEEHRLAGAEVPASDLGQDGVEHHLLLVEKHEGRLGGDHAGGVVQEPLVGPVGAAEDPVQHVEAAARAHAGVEELRQGVELIAGEGRVDS
jgi:hypothetical protein